MGIKNKLIYKFKRDWSVSTNLIYHLVLMFIGLYLLDVYKDRTIFLFTCIFIASTYLSFQIWCAYSKIMDKLDEMEKK